MNNGSHCSQKVYKFKENIMNKKYSRCLECWNIIPYEQDFCAQEKNGRINLKVRPDVNNFRFAFGRMFYPNNLELLKNRKINNYADLMKSKEDRIENTINLNKVKRVLTKPESDVKNINKDSFVEKDIFIPPSEIQRPKVSLGIKYHMVDKSKSKVYDRWDPVLKKRKDFFEKLADKHLANLLEKGWISEIHERDAKFISHSKWVPKFDEKNRVREDKIRLTVALLDINEWSEKLNVNYPKEDEIKESLQGAKFAQKGDVEDGYWMIEIEEKDRPYTAFYAQGKIFMFNRLPMGHTNACNLFHEIVRKRIASVPGTINYIDDVMAWGPTKEIAQERFKEIKERLHWIGMELEKTKSNEEALPRIEFLRMIWDLTGDKVQIFINEAKREKVLSRLRQYSVEEVGDRIEAGLANSIFGDIQYLLRGRQPIKELQDMKREIGPNVKKGNSVKIKNPITLDLINKVDDRLFGGASYKMNNPKTRSTFMHTDASEWGIGILIRTGILIRQYYYFQLKHKVNYTRIIENEAYAALLGLKILAAMGRRNAEINVDNPTTEVVLRGKNPKTKVVDVSKLREEVSRVGITWTTRLQNKDNEEWEMQVADKLSRNKKEEALELLKEKVESLIEQGEVKRYRVVQGMWRLQGELGNEVIISNFTRENDDNGEVSPEKFPARYLAPRI